jgi:hypothetical protein
MTMTVSAHRSGRDSMAIGPRRMTSPMLDMHNYCTTRGIPFLYRIETEPEYLDWNRWMTCCALCNVSSKNQERC